MSTADEANVNMSNASNEIKAMLSIGCQISTPFVGSCKRGNGRGCAGCQYGVAITDGDAIQYCPICGAGPTDADERPLDGYYGCASAIYKCGTEVSLCRHPATDESCEDITWSLFITTINVGQECTKEYRTTEDII